METGQSARLERTNDGRAYAQLGATFLTKPRRIEDPIHKDYEFTLACKSHLARYRAPCTVV